MKILLDTNVWRYIVDTGALPRLQQAARKSRHKVVVAPAVVYEALRTGDRSVRTALVRALALPDWTRLMPEAYSEAMEVRDEVFRVRPQWQRAPADTTLQRRLQFDWKRSRNGFWHRVVHAMDREASNVAQTNLLDLARADTRKIREDAKQLPRSMQDFKLTELRAQPLGPMQGWDGDWLDMWRIQALACWLTALADAHHPYEQWIGGEVIMNFLGVQSSDLVKFWFYDVSTERMPRQWLRTAIGFQQRFHKVTDGTPADAQLGTYLVEVDLLLSADKNLVRIAQRCHREAPFPVADAQLVPANDALEAVLTALRTGTVAQRG
ncbi:hypothetical protein GmRootV213_28880 [Variovorax sp. V213]|uniref:hypothetical protein n=1 Tax=Variovorax sp. V213 TaxID=3065955 RepID=UPI0034E84EA8